MIIMSSYPQSFYIMSDFKFDKKLRIGIICLILAACFITGLGFGFYIKDNLGDGNLSFFVFMVFDIALIFLFSMVVDRVVFASKKIGLLEFHEKEVKMEGKSYALKQIESIGMIATTKVDFNGIMIRYWKKSVVVKVSMRSGEKWQGRVSLKAKKTKIELPVVLTHFTKQHGIKKSV